MAHPQDAHILVGASHGYNLGPHMNERTLLNNVMIYLRPHLYGLSQGISMAYLKVEIVCGFEGQIDMDYRMFEFIGHLFCLPWEGHDWGVH